MRSLNHKREGPGESCSTADKRKLPKTNAERQKEWRDRLRYGLTKIWLTVDGDEISDALWRGIGVVVHPNNPEHLQRACDLIIKAYVRNVVTGEENRLWHNRLKSGEPINADEDSRK